MNKSFKKISLFAMLTASTIFSYITYNLNKGNSQNSVLDVFSDTVEGASCATVISCSTGSGSGSGTATASGSASGTGTSGGC